MYMHMYTHVYEWHGNMGQIQLDSWQVVTGSCTCYIKRIEGSKFGIWNLVANYSLANLLSSCITRQSLAIPLPCVASGRKVQAAGSLNEGIANLRLISLAPRYQLLYANCSKGWGLFHSLRQFLLLAQAGLISMILLHSCFLCISVNLYERVCVCVWVRGVGRAYACSWLKADIYKEWPT